MSADRQPSISHQFIAAGVGLIEAALIALGSAVAPIVYATLSGRPPIDIGSVFGVGMLVGMLYVLAAHSTGLYNFSVLASAPSHFGRIVSTCGSVFLSLTGVFFLMKVSSDYSRGEVLSFAFLTLVLCCLTRAAASVAIGSLIERGAVRGQPVHLIGDGDEVASVGAEYLLRQFGFSVVGRSMLGRLEKDDLNGRQAIANALVAARGAGAKRLLLAAKLDTFETFTHIEHAVRDSPLPVDLLPYKLLRTISARTPGSRDQLIPLQRAPLSAFEQALKRVFDLVFAFVAGLVLLPMFVMAAIALKMDTPGPIIFRQHRVGFDRQAFAIWKFRTMHVLEDGPNIVQATRKDHRVTRVGRVLRRASIDELPQLWNVIKGDMSLVGPRPHALSHDDSYGASIREYCRRHRVKPGITGWAQVHGQRGQTRHLEDMRRRVDYDLWYINNWSLPLDIRILVRTCFTLLGSAAY